MRIKQKNLFKASEKGQSNFVIAELLHAKIAIVRQKKEKRKTNEMNNFL